MAHHPASLMAVTDYTIALNNELKSIISGATDDTTRDLTAAWARSWDEVTSAFQAAVADIVDSDGPVTLVQAARMNRVASALSVAGHQIDDLLVYQSHVAGTATTSILRAVQELEPKMIASQLPTTEAPLAQLAVQFGRVNPATFEAIVARTTQQITSTSKPLTDEATESMLRALVKSIPTGIGPRQAANDILSGTEGEFNGGLGRALTIARTEILDAYRAGSNSIYQANDDVVTGWMWTASLDDNTCISCCVMDGTVFPVDEDGPDDHPNGECTATPVTKSWADMGFTGMDEPASTRPDAEDWFNSLTEDQQLQIAGPARLEAYQSGSVGWSDLATKQSNDGWRDSYIPTPVSALPATVSTDD